jgi:hypothetical protein
MKNYLIIALSVILLTGCTASKKLNLDDLKITPRTAWNSENPKYFDVHVPMKITIHHEGTLFPREKNAPAHIKNVQKWGMSNARYWSDIPYHFLIDPDGIIYEGRNVFTPGETATSYNPSGHLLITCLGNFEEQQLTEEQWNSLILITAWGCKTFNIQVDSIAAHKDFASTSCPGENLYKLIVDKTLHQEVKQVLN